VRRRGLHGHGRLDNKIAGSKTRRAAPCARREDVKVRLAVWSDDRDAERISFFYWKLANK
jgi:hypothetical protein